MNNYIIEVLSRKTGEWTTYSKQPTSKKAALAKAQRLAASLGGQFRIAPSNAVR